MVVSVFIQPHVDGEETAERRESTGRQTTPEAPGFSLEETLLLVSH